MKCKYCKKNEAIKYSHYTSGEFCSKKCARGFSTSTKRDKINKLVSQATKGKKRGHNPVELKCYYCDKSFQVAWKYREQNFCSVSCNKKYYMNQGDIASRMGKLSVSAQNKIKRSKNEIYFGELCQKQFNLVKFNEPMFNGWDADIIIESLKLAVLWNGKWHYEKITKKHSIEQVQNRDKIKLEEIEKADYKSYIIKDLGKWNKKFVEEKFQEMLVYLKLI